MSAEVRVLRAGDEPRLFSFLEPRLETSLFLISNAERAGLVDRGEPYQGTYAASLTCGVITSVAAHYWNGNLIAQGNGGGGPQDGTDSTYATDGTDAPNVAGDTDGLDEAATLAVRETGRPVRGIIGPLATVRRLRTVLGLENAPVATDLADVLFGLDLARLRIPTLLSDPRFALRTPTEREVPDTLAAWRAHYEIEILGAERTPELERRALHTMEAQRKSGTGWVLTRDGTPVAYTAFTAEARGIVQVGGVYTPPEHRRHGYARAAVAASLLRARARGVRRSTLFTSEANVAAIRAYTALGYEPRGDFGLLLFR